MKKITLSLFFLLGISFFIDSLGQSEQTLMTIAGRDISLGEFERIYRKNNNDNVASKQTVAEYLDMFINFKLKVIEAEELGMDTVASFLKEFESYKKQLAKPYMTNPDITEKFAVEAYERMQEEINASHIMIRLDENPDPEDTLLAYNKLIEVRNKVLAGENFETLARAVSDDPSAKSNGGNLGWFSVFRMVYNFETQAYNTPVGEVSMPFRTRFGMHILMVHGKRKALGAIKISHIFVRAPASMTREETEAARQKAMALVDSLRNGADFALLARRHSDDRSSAANGGEIPWIQSGQMIPVFDKAAFALQSPGDFSDAVHSDFGWHIIRLLDKKPIGTFEEEKPDILEKMRTGERATLKKDAFITSLKKEYNVSFRDDAVQRALGRIDSTLVSGTWSKDRVKDIQSEVLFNIDNLKVNTGEFADFLVDRMKKRLTADPRTTPEDYFNSFVDEKLMDYEEDNLANKYEDYRHILQEYHDGILLFDLTDKVVWSKAVEDSSGLEDFYAENKKNYKWEDRAEATIVTLSDSSQISEVIKQSAKLFKKKKFSEQALMNKFCAEDTTGNCMSFTSGKYEKGDNQYVDNTKWKTGVGKVFYSNGKPSFVVVTRILKPEIKELNETRGQVTADYQKFLEDKWVQELRDKYEVEVDMDLLKQIKDE